MLIHQGILLSFTKDSDIWYTCNATIYIKSNPLYYVLRRVNLHVLSTEAIFTPPCAKTLWCRESLAE
jgi:hypothetical protein